MAKQREMEKKKLTNGEKLEEQSSKNNVNYFTKTFKSSKFYGVDDQ